MKRGENGEKGGKGSVSNYSCHKTLKGVYTTKRQRSTRRSKYCIAGNFGGH